MHGYLKFAILYQRTTAWIVLFSSLLLTVIVFVFSFDANTKQRHASFEFKTLQLEAMLNRRIDELEMILRASAGIFSASDEVLESEWTTFVRELNVPGHLPEIQGLGFIKALPENGVDRPMFAPTASAYLKISDKNLLMEQQKRLAMSASKTDRLPVITPVIDLLEEKTSAIHPGFVIYFPVYGKNAANSTNDDGSKKEIGYVFTYFSVQDFMRNMSSQVGDDIHILLFEGLDRAPGALLYNSRPDSPAVFSEPNTKEKTILFAWPTQFWSIKASPGEEWSKSFDYFDSVVILLFGITADLVLFFLFLSLAQRKKELEDEALAIQAQLTNAELVLVSAVEALGEAFVIYDDQDRLVFFNDKYREIYAASAPVIELGNTFEEIIRYGAERGQYVAAIGRVEEWVAERLAIHLEGQTDLIQLLEDGQWLKIRERKTPAGHIVGFRVYVTELYAAKEAAEASNKAKSAFLATMSHEIRTPMNGMLGMAQVLLSPKITEEERIDAARAILRSGQTLLNLLNDILDLSKIEAGKFKLEKTVFSPVDLIRECVFLNMESAQRKQLSIRADSSLEPVTRYIADDTRLRQMLGNLISNAVKFTQIGHIVVRVELITDETHSESLLFSVTDTGPGIPEDKKAQLFLPFVQADSSISRQFGGTGLGLSIVSHLATLMGGEAGVDSEAGQGSCFWFRIKAHKANELADAGSSNGKVELGQAFGHGIPQFVGHVLVVEDDAMSRKVLMSALAKMGLTIVAVEDGDRAVKAVASGETFDLILMDLTMPVMDGYVATSKIIEWLEQKGKKQVPVVAISADAYEDSRKKCLAHGMQGFVEKPLNLNRLSQEIAVHLLQSGMQVHIRDLPNELDEQKVIQLIELIIPLLQQQKFDAFEHFKQLKSHVAKSDIFSEIDAIAIILNNLQFERAETLLRDLANRRSWKLNA